jgi:glycosyltransferase involved in cell wall biosynthesis
VDVLAKAFVRVTGTRPDVGLILLGGSSQGPVIRQILQGGGVLDRVHFDGKSPEGPARLVSSSWICIFPPSHVDGSSVSLMEAAGLRAATGLGIPSNQEWVTEGGNGWHYRDGDAQDLAVKILGALERRELLPMVGLSARAKAEKSADWKKNAALLMQTYEALARVNAK